MKNRQKKISAVILFPLTALFCIIVTTIGLVFLWIPGEVEDIFGPPVNSLGIVERYTLPVHLLLNKNELIIPAMQETGIIELNITPGESPASVATRLYELGVLSNPDSFIRFLVYSGYDKLIQSGSFEIRTNNSAIEIAGELVDPTPGEVLFVILPGWRAEEIARSLATSGLSIQSDEFLEQVNENDGEGFLFPTEYHISREISTEGLIKLLMEEFDKQLSVEMINGFDSLGLSTFQAVTLASIVEREAVIDTEMSLIASVFINRLEVSMKLDADPTVQYSVGYNPKTESWWKSPLSYADLEINHPYNTYQQKGLPPGPIANPGLSALEAVAFSASSPFYYFRAACDGSGKHVFSVTFEEHVNKSCE